jgi:putative hemolysin
MVSLWVDKALNGVMKMAIESTFRTFGFACVVLCILIFPAIGLQINSSLGFDTSGPDRAHCISMGYLYKTVPGVNNGKAICQFPDGTSCDAHSFFNGDCNANSNSYYNASLYNNPQGSYPYPYNIPQGYNPYFNNDPQGALDIAAATKTCEKMGGGVSNVHTPYGDVDLCVFPYGNSIDLRSLLNGGFYNGFYNGPYNGIYNGYGGGDNWNYWAYPWLNAP